MLYFSSVSYRSPASLRTLGGIYSEYLAIDLCKGLSSDPSGCFAENSAGSSTVTHPKQATPRVEP